MEVSVLAFLLFKPLHISNRLILLKCFKRKGEGSEKIVGKNFTW